MVGREGERCPAQSRPVCHQIVNTVIVNNFIFQPEETASMQVRWRGTETKRFYSFGTILTLLSLSVELRGIHVDCISSK